MSKRQQWGYGTFGVGIVLSIIFFIVFAVSSGDLKSGFLSAAMVCLVAAVNGLAVGISDNVKTGMWAGLVTGALGFVVWGIAWLANTCSAGDVACGDLDNAFGFGALFSAIAAVASLFPGLFGGSSAPSSST